jgi:1,4-alpha-glucan branching enzyme
MQARHMETSNLERETSPTIVKLPKARPAEKNDPKQDKRQIELLLEMPQARAVAVAGSFNNWDLKRTPMRKEATTWKASLTLPPGRYEYRFVVDGQWLSDPKAKESVHNSYGTTNSIIVV